MPATGCVIGTPASMRASEPPQTEAIDSTSRSIRECRRRGGSCRGTWRSAAARPSASARPSMPWPISRRPGPRIGLHSPTREGREVVVEHELLRVLAVRGLDLLLVRRGAEGGDRPGPAFRRAGRGPSRGCAAADSDFAGERPDFVELAAVEPGAAEGDARGTTFSSRGHPGLADLLARSTRVPSPSGVYFSLSCSFSSSTRHSDRAYLGELAGLQNFGCRISKYISSAGSDGDAGGASLAPARPLSRNSSINSRMRLHVRVAEHGVALTIRSRAFRGRSPRSCRRRPCAGHDQVEIAVLHLRRESACTTNCSSTRPTGRRPSGLRNGMSRHVQRGTRRRSCRGCPDRSRLSAETPSP